MKFFLYFPPFQTKLLIKKYHEGISYLNKQKIIAFAVIIFTTEIGHREGFGGNIKEIMIWT